MIKQFRWGKSFIASFLLVLSLAPGAKLLAQAQVVEANSTPGFAQQDQGAINAAQAPSGNNDIVLNLYLQLEALQEEVQSLRGTVEEQSYQIRRMQTESLDRYVDVDTRLSELANSTPTPVAGFTPGLNSNTNQLPPTPISARDAIVEPVQTNPGSPLPVSGDNNGFTPPPAITTAVIPQSNALVSTPLVMPQNEQELYRTALNLLVEDSNYEDSIAMFSQYLQDYPNGRYLVNAYYWQGEALILVERFNQAKEAFLFITTNHPDDAKAPGAMMKLVVTYIGMGNLPQASQSLNDLRTTYPASLTEIERAEDYLANAGI